MALFLVAELEGLQTELVRFSEAEPHAVIELAFDLPADEAAPVPVFLRAQGLPAGSVARMRDALSRAYGPVTTAAADEVTGTWSGSFRLRPELLPDPRALLLMRFAGAQGLSSCWIRLQEGTVFLRFQLPARADARRLEQALRDHTAATGLDVQITTESGLGLAAPEDLIRAGHAAGQGPPARDG